MAKVGAVVVQLIAGTGGIGIATFDFCHEQRQPCFVSSSSSSSSAKYHIGAATTFGAARVPSEVSPV